MKILPLITLISLASISLKAMDVEHNSHIMGEIKDTLIIFKNASFTQREDLEKKINYQITLLESKLHEDYIREGEKLILTLFIDAVNTTKELIVKKNQLTNQFDLSQAIEQL